MTLVVAALALLTTAGPHTAYFPTFAIAFGLMGLGMGCAFTPLLELSMADVPADDVGLASGIVQVSMQIAGALGLAVLSTLATSHTHALLAAGDRQPVAFSGGFVLAVTVGAIAVASGIVVALATLRRGARPGDEQLVGATDDQRFDRQPAWQEAA
jgi:MFS family permease